MQQVPRNMFVSPGLRLIQLYTLMSSSGRPYSLGRLAALFHCSRQTILRMTEQMACLRDVQLDSWKKGKTRYYQVQPSATPTGISLSDTTIRHLLLCHDIVRHILPGPLQEELGALEGNESNALEQLAEPWVKGRIDYSAFQHLLDDVQTAMHEKRLCSVTYDSRSTGKRAAMLIAPRRIIGFHEALYIRCRVYDTPAKPRTEYRTLAVHRIARLQLRRETFADETRDDAEPHFGFPFHEPVLVRVAFWRGAATYVSERTWSADQTLRRRRDGGIELIFSTTSRLETIAWVLSFGPDAELIEPQDLREELRNQIEQIRTRYVNENAGHISLKSKGERK